MDMITLAMAKVYSDSKGGYVGKGTIISGELTDGTYQDFTTKLEAGKKYTLKLDSGIYSGVAIDYGNTGDLFYIGNLAIMGEEFADVNTGESYCVGYMSLDNVFAVTDSNNSKTFSLEGETIHPIDQKYLPGVCLPVVEIADLTAITAEEGAELGKHIGMPVVIKVTIDGTLNCCIFNYTYVDAYRMHLYGTTIGTDAVILTSSDGVSWTKG